MDDISNLKEESREEMINSTANWSSSNDVNGDGGVNLDVDNTFYFDPLSPFNLSFFVPSSSRSYLPNSTSDSKSDFESASESGSEFNDYASYRNCFYGDDQMNFVTDLFESNEQYVSNDDDDNSGSISDPISDALNDDAHDLGLGFGVEIEGRVGGLRVVGIESDSDTQEVDSIEGGYDSGTVGDMDSDYPIFWDCDDQRAIGREEFDWENVDGRTDDREGLTSMINRIEEMSVSSEISSDGEGVRAIEWEILLAINNLERNFEFENDMDGYADTVGEYDTIVVGQIVESDSVLKGSPPAAKSFVDSLPYVVLTKEDVMENSIVCAVCKDEISVGEKAAQLPCCHHYHGECIVPWLSIRNTCPVCRFELPTDDADYEQRKNRSGGGGGGGGLGFLDDDSQVTYIFELLP